MYLDAVQGRRGNSLRSTNINLRAGLRAIRSFAFWRGFARWLTRGRLFLALLGLNTNTEINKIYLHM